MDTTQAAPWNPCAAGIGARSICDSARIGPFRSPKCTCYNGLSVAEARYAGYRCSVYYTPVMTITQ